jgi:HB1, ASXL, restriction endonuclease HTH domain
MDVKTGTAEFPRYDWTPRAKITDRFCLRPDRHRVHSGDAHQALGEEDGMSTLAVVEAILREAAMPLSVREIVERAGDALPTKSKTPDTVVARDLSMDIKKKGDGSTFARTSPGRYAIRDQASAAGVSLGEDVQPIAPPGLSAVPPVAQPTGLAAADQAGPTSLVGPSLPHDRNGARPAPAKGPSKPQSNSEDTPMSA